MNRNALPEIVQRIFFRGSEHKLELIQKSSQAFCLKILGLGVGYVTIGLITNMFGAKVYGEFALAMVVLNIAVLLPKFGLDGALVKIVGELVAKGESVWPTVKRAMFFSGTLALVVSTLLYFLAPMVAGLLNKPAMTTHLRTISLAVLPVTIIGIVAANMRGFRRTSASTAIPILAKIVMLAALLLFGFVVSVDVVSLQVVSFALAGMAVLIWFIRDLEIKAGVPVDYRHMLTLAFPMMLTSSFTLIINWVDVLMIGSMMREEDVGLYSVAFRLASITSIGLISINTIAGPKFVQFYTKQDMPNFKRTAQQSTKLILLVSVPILGVMLLFPATILGFFGPEFVDAKMALILLVVGRFASAFCGSVGLVLQMTGGERVVMWVIIGTALLNIMLNLLFIPRWGIEGGAAASMLSVIAWNFAMLLAVRIRLGFWVTGLK